MLRTFSILSIFIAVISFFAFAPGNEQERPLPATPAELGKLLFFDNILSRDRSINCSSCHKPEFAFADNVPFSFGVDSAVGTRNAPSVLNLAGHDNFFWDGRTATLEEQALGPIENPIEMALNLDSALARLNADPFYSKAFRKIYRSKATRKNLGEAIAAYEVSLFTVTPFDKWMQGDSTAMSPEAIRGREIFNVKGKCFDCHKGPDFSLDEFKNIGLYNGTTLTDKGRYEFTKDSADLGKFKTPGLRNVALTAPYMHNGMFNTLREVIDYYDEPGKFVQGSIGADTLIVPKLGLTEREKKDLEAFLNALTGPVKQ